MELRDDRDGRERERVRDRAIVGREMVLREKWREKEE